MTNAHPANAISSTAKWGTNALLIVRTNNIIFPETQHKKTSDELNSSDVFLYTSKKNSLLI